MLQIGCCCLLSGQPASYAYRPAAYDALSGVSQHLKVFPLQGEAFQVPLPFELGLLAYAPNGHALYGSYLRDSFEQLKGEPGHPGIYKIEFNPTRILKIPGSDRVGQISLAVAAKHENLFVTGGGLGVPCAILAIPLATGSPRVLVRAPDCTPWDTDSEWQELAVSPDEKRATTWRRRRLHLVEFNTGNITDLPPNYIASSWSPDGKWLAVMKSGGDTVLLDSRTLREQRNVGNTMLKWSPDSRYLLAAKRNCGTFSEISSLEILDVETGKRTEVTSSHCQINRGADWVSTNIMP